jgi:hypothetical protein
MDVPAGSLPEVVLCTDFSYRSHAESLTHQGILHMLIQNLRAQLPPGMSHAELRLRMKEECRPDLIEEMPHPEILGCLCWAIFSEYIYSVFLFL